ncbi:hypothetical protein [Micromonospora gifhornensis]|uniref:hypothetical protein n=1 Tax=Micromonospora gifhornensis TaxID=84594 RepID=UPI003D759DDB
MSMEPGSMLLMGRRSVLVVTGRWHPEHGPEGFLAAAADQARLVLDAGEGWPTYYAGIEFQGLAVGAMSETPTGEYLPDIPTALNLIWGALTDEMDAPGRGSPEQDAAAVRHMKQAAAEWLTVVNSPVDRATYLDHWVHEECGYRRRL